MKKQSKIFTKGDRELLHGILSGTVAKTQGVKIQWFQRQIRAILLQKWGIDLPITTLNQIIYWKSNNQFVWQAAYDVCEKHRPGLFDELINEQKQAELEPAC